MRYNIQLCVKEGFYDSWNDGKVRSIWLENNCWNSLLFTLLRLVPSVLTCVFSFFIEVLSAFPQVNCIIDLACEDKKALDLTTVLQVPLMKVDAIEDITMHPFVASIRPSYHLVSQAVFDVMDFFSFSRIAVVYEGRFPYSRF